MRKELHLNVRHDEFQHYCISCVLMPLFNDYENLGLESVKLMMIFMQLKMPVLLLREPKERMREGEEVIRSLG